MHHCKKEKKKKIRYTTVPQKRKKTTVATKHIICEKCLNITQALFEIVLVVSLSSGFSVKYYLGVFGVHHAIEDSLTASSGAKYGMNKRDPRTDPCGMPDVNS